MTVTVLPPGPERPDLRFDKHQFSNRKLQMVTADSRLTFGDTDRMHVHNRAEHRHKTMWRAQWAQNDAQFKEVVLHRCANYCLSSGGSNLREGISSDDVKRACDIKFNEDVNYREPGEPGSIQRQIHDAHRYAVARFGGYLNLVTLVLWRALRLEETSVEVAKQMGINPSNVRQIVTRANDEARKLGFTVYEREHWAFGAKRKENVTRDAENKRKRRSLLLVGKRGRGQRKCARAAKLAESKDPNSEHRDTEKCGDLIGCMAR